MKRFESVAATAFGVVFLVLALAVAVESISRKVFSISLQGVDELGGYCLAIGGSLSFTVALLARAHIRIDILHDYFPRALRIVLNVLSVITLAISAGALTWMAWVAFSDSVLFHSSAQTPWATPLRYPQGLWVAALGTFFVTALVQLVRVAMLLGASRLDAVDHEFSPRGAKEEVAEELEDIKSRGVVSIEVDGSSKL